VLVVTEIVQPDSDFVHAGITMARFYVKAGARGFDDYSYRMVLAFGEIIRPYLRSFYEGARVWPGEQTDAEMWPSNEIDRYLASAAGDSIRLGASTGGDGDTEGTRGQIRQLIKQALENPTPEGLERFLEFATRFRRLAVWNARMAYIQRPGARAIASEFEWVRAGREVLPDAVPIIILWPFSPIRVVYELADTGPPIDREQFNDPFAVKGQLRAGALSQLISNLKKEKTFKVVVELRRQGFDRAGSAARTASPSSPGAGTPIGTFARENSKTTGGGQEVGPSYRIVINDALAAKEQFVTLTHELGHIFCGHLGGCKAPGREEDESGWPDRCSLGTHEKEIEAEAVAYVVSGRAGLIPRSAEYLRIHAQRADMGRVSEDLIVRAASRIERLAKIHYGKMLFRLKDGR
jgi:IrrE N-terminal-like domain